MTDDALMERAVALSRRARFSAPPNPWVGAVIVDAGGVVGQGWTQPLGGPHAEVVALREAGERAHGATMYVTLEPCAHHGRTPPCVEAIEAAGIGRVVVAIQDPDERVAGRGFLALRQAGIALDVGIGAEAVVDELLPYLYQRRSHRPWVLAKVAMTLDAKVADGLGVSQWITSAPARERGHELRARVGAIAVGANTMEVDHPQLTARPKDVGASFPQPERWVFARRPLSFCTPGVKITKETPEDFLDRLGAEGVLELLVEGGPTLLGSFLDHELVDELFVYVAPIIFGDQQASDAFRLTPPALLGDPGRFVHRGAENIGDDVELRLRSRRAEQSRADFVSVHLDS